MFGLGSGAAGMLNLFGATFTPSRDQVPATPVQEENFLKRVPIRTVGVSPQQQRRRVVEEHDAHSSDSDGEDRSIPQHDPGSRSTQEDTAPPPWATALTEAMTRLQESVD